MEMFASKMVTGRKKINIECSCTCKLISFEGKKYYLKKSVGI